MSNNMEAKSNLENKRAQFKETNQKKKPTVKIIIAMFVVALGLAWYLVATKSSNNTTSGMVKTADSLQISLSELDGGKAQFLNYQLANNTEVRLFALKSADGKYRAAMDACDTCFHAKKGYRQEGSAMICNNCGMHFQNNLINEVKGGCNPVGVACSVEGNQLVIKTSELESRGSYFQ